MRSALLGAYSYAEFAACAVAFLPVMALSHLRHRRDPTQRIPGRWMRRFGRATVRLSPLWRFGIRGDAPPDIDRRAYVVVANHASTADPFLLSFLPWDMRWVAKRELFRIPLIGWLLAWSGDIPLRRGDAESVRAMMDTCRATLAGGLSVMLFPEGTRSPDGALLPFKNGAFELAIDAQVPVLPIAIEGTRSCRPKGSRWFGEADAAATILAPIETKGMTAADLPRLRDLARARIAQSLGVVEERPEGASQAAAHP